MQVPVPPPAESKRVGRRPRWMKTFVEGKVACGLGDGAQNLWAVPVTLPLTWLGLQPGGMLRRSITRVLCSLKYGSFLGTEASFVQSPDFCPYCYCSNPFLTDGRRYATTKKKSTEGTGAQG